MKKIFTGLFTLLLFIGCSSNATVDENVEPKLVVKNSLADLKLNDQNGNMQGINPDTKKVVFAFSKENGHTCNDFFATKADSYLKENKTQFVADVSAAPSLIRSMFIMPGMKDFNHPILIIDNEMVSAAYKTEENSEKIVLVLLDNQTITDIKYLKTAEELEKEIER
ncbi:MAG: hypothetical protein AUK54_06525 [Helicobacteraceae bacterium CG2_30_36_10]|nr:MAG: hypothetical protein AUK54_06525 [Helicobacteraceae bacterium CG2_30_36_10]